MLHEDYPKMSVAQGLVASTSQVKSDIILETPSEYEMSITESKPTQSNIEMEMKIAYVDPTSDNPTFLLRASISDPCLKSGLTVDTATPDCIWLYVHWRNAD
ncbi:unnamed protein product [Colias eurytheme]|nr:unnamed protein product [Colias eurytheme]